MRRRIIDPEFWLDEKVAHLSSHARLLFIGLWGLCDDNYATFPNRPDWIKAQVFPYEKVDTRRLLDELSTSARIILFTGENGEEFYYIKNFFKYQKVDRPSRPKYAQFDEKRAVLDEPSTSPRPEVKLSEVKLSKENKEKAFSKREDLTESVLREVSDRYGGGNPKFLSFVKSKFEDICLWEDEKPGRMEGRNWKLTLMNWVKRDAIKLRGEAIKNDNKRGIDASEILRQMDSGG